MRPGVILLPLSRKIGEARVRIHFVDQYIATPGRYRAVAIGVGDQDELREDSGKLHDVLDKYGITNSF